ncbi:sensor histidine kinase [Noviherbaspirillum soli]|uniref:sensor histidine kinase n=1 Tax=Noviherbaspirillum soli TaxID=1064518 RepID=UPI00188B4E32|nr:histidine kinase [Noviherbaspirillum soli]
MSATVPAAAPVSVLPDCCNLGVILRTLVAVNGAVMVAILAQAQTLGAAILSFIEASVLVELASLASLLILCAARKPLAHFPPWLQRPACMVVPASVTAVIIRFLATLNLYVVDPAGLAMIQGVVTAALLGTVLQHYFELRTRAFSPALAEARLQALQARIRPHFLFNSLNAVLSLIRTAPRQAEATLEDLAELFRALLRDARDLTTLEQELRLCEQYLSIEKIRLGERLQVEWELTNMSDEVLHSAQIPSLLLQPLLENAVHHGVEPAREPMLVQIHLSRWGDRLDIAVINPHHPDRSSPGNHMALDNIRERLALLYDVEAHLVTTIARGFFEVRLRFPYVKES